MAKRTKYEPERHEPEGHDANRASGGNRQRGSRPDDIATRAIIERLEAIAGGADEDDPRLFLDPNLSLEVAKLNATTEEEVDALRLDLTQDSTESGTDGSDLRANM